MMQRFLLSVALLLALSTTANAHPFHVSHAQVEFNAKSSSLEVALHVHAIDLERVLHQVNGKPVDLDKTKKIDEQIKKYLRQVFLVHLKGKKKPLKLKWIGKETTVKSAWLYFEVPIPKKTQTVEISHHLFFKTVDGQQNIINYRNGKSRRSFRFTAAKPKYRLVLRKRK